MTETITLGIDPRPTKGEAHRFSCSVCCRREDYPDHLLALARCVLFAVAVAGCSKTPIGRPQVTISANPVDVIFGNQPAGSSTSKSVTLKNDSVAILVISSIAILGDTRSAFTVGATPNSLSPAASASVQVTYAAPHAARAAGATLTVPSNADNAPQLSVSLSAQSVAACAPESNVAFCTRVGKNCGSVTALDNCGTSRTVASCGTCAGVQTCSGAGVANVCGTPTFAVTVTLAGAGSGTVTSIPAGINCSTGTCLARFDSGSTVTLTATPGSSSLFIGFSGACTGQTCSFTNLSAAKDVAATFSSLGQWTCRASMPTARGGEAVGAAGGALYVVEGVPSTTANEAYNPSANTWATKAPGSVAGRLHGSAAGIGGNLYVTGGCARSDCRIRITGALEGYDTGLDTWATKAPMPTGRFQAGSAELGGKLYVVGGITACPPCNLVAVLEVYDPVTNTWATKKPLGTARGGLAAASLNGILYAVGGSTTAAVGTLEVYDPATDTWTAKASMPTPRGALAAAAFNGLIYAISGNDATGTLAVVEAYDPVTDTWSTKAPVLTPRYGGSAAVIANVLFLTGATAGNAASDKLEAYTP